MPRGTGVPAMRKPPWLRRRPSRHGAWMIPTLAAIALALGAAPPAAAGEDLPFAPGEQIEYSVHYLGIEVGSLRLRVGRPEGPVLPLLLQTQTKGLASVADVREQIATFWDTATRLPRGSRIDAQEMSYWHSDTTRFDRVGGKATVTQQPGQLPQEFKVLRFGPEQGSALQADGQLVLRRCVLFRDRVPT